MRLFRTLAATSVLAISVHAVTGASSDQSGDAPHAITLPGDPLGIAWGFLYGYSGVPAAEFLPTVRALGGGFSKVYLFWEQLEPHEGQYDFSALDAYVDQLRRPEEGLVSIFSASTWATEKSATMLPPSPARDLQAYYRMVHAAVAHVRGRVRYWQNDCEPNNPIYWAGTKEQFVAQLKVFYRAVKDADPDAIVVVGGYDGLFNPPGMWEFPGQKAGLEFFDYVLREGGDDFDLFDLRLYADPYTIEARVKHVREMMQAAGHVKPIICTEYNGPGFFEFPANLAQIPLIQKWGAAAGRPEEERAAAFADVGREIAALYDRMSSLPPQTQMFLQGCPPELEARLRRLQGRDIVYRNLFALAAGVQKTLYWDLWHDVSKRDDMMTIMYGKLRLMERSPDGGLTSCNPTSEVFARLAGALAGVESVQHREIADPKSNVLLEVTRRNRPPLLVVWQRRDPFDGDGQPAVPVSFACAARVESAVDAFGNRVATRAEDGRLRLEVTGTPVLIELAGPQEDEPQKTGSASNQATVR